ncbi:MAG: NAD(P)H-hydrate epimerase [Sedimentisphaerales bacterium]|nr:NAD(P)H-hydrate epimerase [Sedimentisphaerales bacterium]
MEQYLPEKQNSAMTRDEARAFDFYAINTIGIPGVVLMENAGRSCAELIKEQMRNTTNPKVCIFCGTGNNGGDGYVIARHLRNVGYRVTIVICGDKNKIKGDAKINLDILIALNQVVEQVDPDAANIMQEIKEYASNADIIVDCLLGTGLKGIVKDGYKLIIETINSINCPVLAVDIPSGLDCDTGIPLGAAIRADYTVSFIALKKGFSTEQSSKYTGEIYIASIGIEPY